jgi:hypothetical protein
MAKIVAVHGIAQQGKGPHRLHTEWYDSLCDGLRYSGITPAREDLVCVSYGDLFRREIMGLAEEEVNEADLSADELALMELIWAEAARVEPDDVIAPDSPTMGLRHRVAHRIFEAMSYSKRLTNLVEKGAPFFYGSLRQVTAYMSDPEIRRRARDIVTKAITEETRVVVGHSLGSVVAYEALCAGHGWNIRMFMTLGSPLAIRSLIFDRLDPAPVDGLGGWPACVREWHNFADRNDIVALVKNLNGPFGPRVHDLLVDNELSAHDVKYYLSDRRTGNAIASGLAGA